jgi:hypothetical protein
MPEARSSRTIASASGANDLQPAEPLRQQLEKIYQFLAAPSPVPFEWAVRQQHAVLDYVTAPEGKEPPAISVDLVNLARAMVDGDQKTGRARAFRARPLVIAQRIGITGSGGTRKLVKSFDIIYNRMHFLGSDPMLAVRQGVFETELERAVFPGAEVFNTSTVFERSAGAVQVFRAGEQQKVAALNLGAGVTRLISDDLSAGYVVLVPSARVQIAGRAVTGWWRVRPDGGETLGRMESGEGQGMIEKVITTALTAIPSIYAFAAGKWCKSATGFCNPCLIAFAGFVGTVIGLHNFAVGGGVQLAWRGLNLNVPAGLVYGGVMGAGAYGMWQRTSKCGDFLLDWAMGG